MRIVVDRLPKKCQDCICTKEVKINKYDDYVYERRCVFLDKEIPYTDSYIEKNDKLEKCPLVSFEDMMKEKEL